MDPNKISFKTIKKLRPSDSFSIEPKVKNKKSKLLVQAENMPRRNKGKNIKKQTETSDPRSIMKCSSDDSYETIDLSDLMFDNGELLNSSDDVEAPRNMVPYKNKSTMKSLIFQQDTEDLKFNLPLAESTRIEFEEIHPEKTEACSSKMAAARNLAFSSIIPSSKSENHKAESCSSKMAADRNLDSLSSNSENHKAEACSSKMAAARNLDFSSSNSENHKAIPSDKASKMPTDKKLRKRRKRKPIAERFTSPKRQCSKKSTSVARAGNNKMKHLKVKYIAEDDNSICFLSRIKAEWFRPKRRKPVKAIPYDPNDFPPLPENYIDYDIGRSKPL